MKHNRLFKERFHYYFDRFMSRGSWPLIGLLSAFCAVVIAAAGYVTAEYSGGTLSFRSAVWMCFTHMLSSGLLGKDKTDNRMFVIMMTVVTFCGVFVASILIGTITSAFGTKLRELRKGHSPILEKNHTVILGFNENIFALVSQLVEANRNSRRSCIVILGFQNMETMDELLSAHITDFGKTEIIVRSVTTLDDSIFKMAHLENAKSIIINEQNDIREVKALLAVSCFLSEYGRKDQTPNIIASIRDRQNLRAAQIAGSGKAHIVYIKDMLARIIAHTTRHSGFSNIFTDFFDFEGNEFYSESFPELAGKKFGDILCLFEKSAVIGIERHQKNGTVKVMMNPPMDTVIAEDDLVIHFAEDDHTSFPDLKKIYDTSKDECIVQGMEAVPEALNVLILGENEMLPEIVEELDNYVASGSTVELTCAENSIYRAAVQNGSLKHIHVTNVPCNIYDHATISCLLEKRFTNIVLLSDLSASAEDADNRTLLLLLYLRDVADEQKYAFQITSEIRSTETQDLARVINVNDFIVGSNLTNLIMTQYSEDPSREQLFNDILDSDGSEIYMKPASCYVKTGEEVNFYTVTKSAAIRNEIPIGYRRAHAGVSKGIVLNPCKSDTVTFSDGDMLVLVAEN